MPTPPSNPKLTGEEAECAFLWQAIRHGLVVAKPYGDSAPYDFIVDSGPYQGKQPRLLRVQVRCARWQSKGWYPVSAAHSDRNEPMTREHTDFLVAFIPAHEAWYIIPVGALKGLHTGIAFHPQPPTRSRWERYREAWGLLGGKEVVIGRWGQR